jgi:CheY-like chemotaxis protein
VIKELSNIIANLIDDLDDSIIIASRDTGKVLYSNNRATELFEYSKEDLEKIDFKDLFTENVIDTYQNRFTESKDKSNTWTDTLEIKTLSSRLNVDLTFKTIKHDNETFFSMKMRPVDEKSMKDTVNDIYIKCNDVINEDDQINRMISDFSDVFVAVPQYKLVMFDITENDEDHRISPLLLKGSNIDLIDELNQKLSESELTDFKNMSVKGISININLKETNFSWGNLIKSKGINSVLIIPLIVKGLVFGSYTIFSSQERNFHPVEIRTYTRIIDKLSVVLTKKFLGELENAVIDSDTEGKPTITYDQIEEFIDSLNNAFTVISNCLFEISADTLDEHSSAQIKKLEAGVGDGIKSFKRLKKKVAEKESSLPHEPKFKLIQGDLETILLVEDDDNLRRLIEAILKKNNYTVFSSNNPMEGLEIYRQEHDSIDLVLSDIMMPDKNGFELASDMKEIDSDVKIIFMSGHEQDSLSEEKISNLSIHFLQKPFTPTTLIQTLRTIFVNE